MLHRPWWLQRSLVPRFSVRLFATEGERFVCDHNKPWSSDSAICSNIQVPKSITIIGSHFRPPPVSPLLRDSVSSDDEHPLDLGPKVRKKPRHPQKPASMEPGVNLSHRSVLLFPGQGSQFVGMGKKLLEVPTVRELYAEASQILGYDLLALSLDGPQNLLDRTQYCQPATVVASLAAVELLYQVQNIMIV